MRRSSRLSEKQAKPTNEDQRQPRAKKKRSEDRISTIATLDNGTMVEAFKFFNYCQLAKNSIVSKRFSNLIRTHRHKLAFLYVHTISMSYFYPGPLSSKYSTKSSRLRLQGMGQSQWIPKQIPIEDQIVEKQSAQYGRKVYVLWGFARYNGNTNAFYAKQSSSISIGQYFNTLFV